MTRRRAHQDAIEAIPDFVEVVIIAVRAGLAPTRAVTVAARHAAPALRPALDDARLRLERGSRLADALAALPERFGAPAAPFVDALAAADRYGLALEPVLDRLASDARTERRRHAERYARTLPVRLSFPLVACTLPAFVLLSIVPALMGALSTLRGLAP